MEKVMNFRDLGGIPTKDGRHVKSNLFYRSAMLDDATEDDIAFLKSLKLKYVFDYRDVEEVNRNNEIIYKRVGAKHMHYPNNIKSGKVYKLQNGGLNRAFIKIMPSDVCEFYSQLPFTNKGYQSMIETLLRGDTPFLQHCTAGKDRAGIGTALLLGILGVSYDEILKDYLESLKIHDYIKDKMIGGLPKFVKKAIEGNYETLFIVDKCYLDAAKDAVLGKYGTYEEYVSREYGITEETLKALRDKYTE